MGTISRLAADFKHLARKFQHRQEILQGSVRGNDSVIEGMCKDLSEACEKISEFLEHVEALGCNTIRK